MALDLKRITNDLINSGMTQSEIARQIEKRQPTVWRYITGETKSCDYDTGVRLLELHRQRVLERRT